MHCVLCVNAKHILHYYLLNTLFISGNSPPFPTGTPTNHPSQDLALYSVGNRGSLISTSSTVASKPRSLVTLAGLIGDSPQPKDAATMHKVKVGVSPITS